MLTRTIAKAPILPLHSMLPNAAHRQGSSKEEKPYTGREQTRAKETRRKKELPPLPPPQPKVRNGSRETRILLPRVNIPVQPIVQNQDVHVSPQNTQGTEGPKGIPKHPQAHRIRHPVPVAYPKPQGIPRTPKTQRNTRNTHFSKERPITDSKAPKQHGHWICSREQVQWGNTS